MTAKHFADKPWLAHYEPGVHHRIEYDTTCLPGYLERSAELFPERMALLFEGYEVNYRELNEMVNRIAACLTAMGVKRGDRVAILLPNLIPCVVSYFAILKIGAVAVMNNPLYTDREVLHQFKDSDARLLITLDLLGNRMIDLREKTSIRQIIYTSIGDYLPFPKNYLFRLFGKKKKLAATVKSAPDVYRWKDVIGQYPAQPPQVPLTFEDIAMFQYTGGTTGISKGVILTHGNLSKQVQQIRAWFPAFDFGEERMLGALPFFHVFGLSTAMNFSIFMGWGHILVPKPQPEPLLKAIKKYRPTFSPLVPTMFIGLLNHPEIETADLTSIKGCFSGSAPLPVEIINAFEQKTGAIIVEGYGLTETAPVTHVNPFKGQRKVGSIGVPFSDTLARIVDLEDPYQDVPLNEPGELLIKGPQVMQGYHNMPDENATVFSDGWLRTGDVAKMDEDGYFYIVDRKKDVILSGGLNIYPRDIEEVLYEHPKVQEVCAIGIPHAYKGEVVKVFVVLKQGQKASEEELIEYCRPKLAIFKLPKEIEFRIDLPKSNVGKVLRKELRSEELSKQT
jgi:long-chain acyl-CoA synthetase